MTYNKYGTFIIIQSFFKYFRLRDLLVVIRDSSLCGLGQSAPNPILSTLDNFYDE